MKIDYRLRFILIFITGVATGSLGYTGFHSESLIPMLLMVASLWVTMFLVFMTEDA